jgi:preprotein translocase subunit YajC
MTKQEESQMQINPGDTVNVSGTWGTAVNVDSEGVTVRYADLDERWTKRDRVLAVRRG